MKKIFWNVSGTAALLCMTVLGVSTVKAAESKDSAFLTHADGYADGYNTGYVLEKTRRCRASYDFPAVKDANSNPQYQEGFAAGFNQGRGDEERQLPEC